MARVSAVRRNLKEAGGKAQDRRTETAYEAALPGEEAKIFNAQYLYGGQRCICGGHRREGGCALPGEVRRRARECYGVREGVGYGGGSQQRA